MEEKDIKQIGELFDSKLNEFGEIVNNGFVEMDKRFEAMDKKFDNMENKFEKRFVSVEGRLTKIESQMVTKEYLDDKLADLKGDLVAKVRLEDEKVNKTIDLLDKHEIIPGDELKAVKDIELFPKLSV